MTNDLSVQEAVFTNVWGRALSNGANPENKRSEEELKYHIAGYSNDLLRRVGEFMSTYPVYAGVMANCITVGEKESLISEYMQFAPELASNLDISLGLCLVRGLHFYPQLPPCDDYGTAEEGLQNMCRNLLRVAAQVDEYIYVNSRGSAGSEGLPLRPMVEGGGNCDEYMKIDDEVLIDVALSNSSRVVDLLVDTIRDRNTVDWSELRVVLESPSIAIAEGAL